MKWGIESGLLTVVQSFKAGMLGPPLAKAQVSFFKSLFFISVHHKYVTLQEKKIFFIVETSSVLMK